MKDVSIAAWPEKVPTTYLAPGVAYEPRTTSSRRPTFLVEAETPVTVKRRVVVVMLFGRLMRVADPSCIRAPTCTLVPSPNAIVADVI